MKQKYLDLHIHTSLSDGAHTPEEVCRQALESGLDVISITDHNCMSDLSELQCKYPDLHIIPGAEVSATYTDPAGTEREVHIIALNADPASPALQAVLRKNQPDRGPYVNKILDRLREHDIDLGDYRSLLDQYPGSRYVGRMHIAQQLCQRGYTASVDEGFDRYIGGHGLRLAYVEPPHKYVPLEEAVQAILAANGIPVLCHLYYYCMDDAGNEALVRRFREWAGDRGAMEVLYGMYGPEQRQALAELADRYGLMHSAASDFHGQAESDRLDHHFPCDACRALLEAIGKQT